MVARTWQNRLAGAHLVAVLLPYVLVAFIPAATIFGPHGAFQTLAYSLFVLSPVLFLTWLYAIYFTARRVVAARGGRLIDWSAVFVIPAIACVVGSAGIWIGTLSTSGRPGLFPICSLGFFPAFFAAIWITGATLERGVEANKPVSIGWQFLNFVLFFYLLIGIWFLRPKIRAVCAADAAQTP